MCGRFSFVQDKEIVKSRFNLISVDENLEPSFNIAPGQLVPTILNETPQDLSLSKWGLIPFWAKDENIGYRMINARAETIADKPSFRRPVRKQRCLILADAFYEWKKDNGGKTPYRVLMEDESVFAMAGIWDVWKGIRTCSIVTIEANEVMMPIHDRMPVILPKGRELDWLAEDHLDILKSMLKPCDASLIKAYAISKLVNSPKNTSENIIKPVY